MNPETALKALKIADQEKEASPLLEARLLDAFRARQKKPRGKAPWWLLAGAAAALAMAAVVYFRPAEAPRREVNRAEVPVEVPLREPVIEAAVEAPKAVPAQRPAVRPRREVVTEFFPLMDVAPPLGRGQLLRLQVPAGAMRTVGLPVREERLNERIEADVLVGEEGMARAIRFVSWQ